MNEYDIAIRETLEMTVTVEAESREEARQICLLYTSPSPRDYAASRMPSSA